MTTHNSFPKSDVSLEFPLEQTRRATAHSLEDILYSPIKLLDHGFIRVIDYMGDDNAIVQAARVSYGKGTKKVSEDQGLIRYLLRHKHTTPFEMCEIKLHVKMPFFVARQWLRHRTANVNEYSARYSILSREFYIPELHHIAKQSKSNRQGRDEAFSPEEAQHIMHVLRQDAEHAYDHYQALLNENDQGEPIRENQDGLSRELARMNLTLNYYTEMYWKIDLHNLMHFIRLRADDHAQYEIRVYAQALLEILKKWVPTTYQAFMDYSMEAKTLSKQSLEVVKRLLRGESVTQESSNMSPREWRELQETLHEKS